MHDNYVQNNSIQNDIIRGNSTQSNGTQDDSTQDNSVQNKESQNEQTQNNPIETLRARMIAESLQLDTPQNIDKWWLLGTSSCHLCDIAEQIISQFQAVQPITYETIDIANFNEPLMMEFATTIPVILTPTKRLNYPFSVMDLQGLLTP